jgi:hypothetical protein
VWVLNSTGSGLCRVAMSCEHGNEPSCSIKGGEFIDQLNEYQVFKKDSAPWRVFQIQSLHNINQVQVYKHVNDLACRSCSYFINHSAVRPHTYIIHLHLLKKRRYTFIFFIFLLLLNAKATVIYSV